MKKVFKLFYYKRVSMNLQEERKLWGKGYHYVVGLDEAGRGPLAGPVVAAAVIIKNPKSKTLNSKKIQSANNQNTKQFRKLLKEVKDSKQLSSKKREELYREIVSCPYIVFRAGKAGEKVIDKINILEATKLAMERAVEKLKVKSEKLKTKGEKRKIDFLILDGKMKLDLDISQKSIVKADQKVFSCAVASIIAKVRRDSIMKRKAKIYPRYGFEKHKGYLTKEHFKMLKKYGPSVIHRKTFKPITFMIK